MSIPATLKRLRAEVADLHESVNVAGTAQAEMLHRLEEQARCLRVLLRLSRHIHGMLTRANGRPAKSSGVRKKRPRGAH